MEKKYFLTLVAIHLFFTITSQNEAKIWYFGENAGIDFSTSPPNPLTNGSLNTVEGCSTICDNTGNLLFYTDGTTVYNKLHLQMQNGTGLGGNFSTAQSALIIKKPNSSNIYYVFTASAQNSTPGLTYSVVDMNLAGGLGAVSSLNNFLLFPVTEMLTAVNHSNGTDIWVISHEWFSDAFYSYLVTSNGINSPIVTHVGMLYTGPWVYSRAIGTAKFSSDGSLFASTMTYGDSLQLFNFNNSTGIPSNPKTINMFRAYGLEFSESNNFLYVSSGGGPNGVLMQYNISSGVQSIINASGVQLGLRPLAPYGMLQMGLDGKIYVSKTPDAYLGKIDNPEISGTACTYIDSAVYLGGKISRIGLPGYNCSFFSQISTNITTNNSSSDVFSIYPNPVNGNSRLNFHIKNDNLKLILIIDCSGAIVMKIEKIEQNVIDVSEIEKGLYIYKAITKSGKEHIGKLIIQ